MQQQDCATLAAVSAARLLDVSEPAAAPDDAEGEPAFRDIEAAAAAAARPAAPRSPGAAAPQAVQRQDGATLAAVSAASLVDVVEPAAAPDDACTPRAASSPPNDTLGGDPSELPVSQHVSAIVAADVSNTEPPRRRRRTKGPDTARDVGQAQCAATTGGSDAADASGKDAPAREQGEVEQQAPQLAQRRAYSVQYSDTSLPGHRRPCSFTRQGFAVLLEMRHTEAFQELATAGCPANRVVKVMVFKELHSEGAVNYFAGVLCDRPYRIRDVQAALRAKDGVYVGFGCCHTFFWTIAVYGGVPTVHKGVRELDKDPYHSEGRTLREELADIPKGARKVDKDRVRSYLGLAAPAGGKAPACGLSLDDLAEMIRTNNWQARQQLLDAAGAQRRQGAPALYETVLRMGAKRLDEMITTVRAMEGDDLEPTGCRVQKLLDAAVALPCCCGGQWRSAAERLLQIQCLDSVAVRSAVVRGLRWGRNKWTNVLIVGEPDAGKSFILRPLGKIFKTFIRRGQNETFALQGVNGNDICLLQDVRYESFGLPWDDWLAWGEGEDVTVKLPRNHFAESIEYKGTAPLFATMANSTTNLDYLSST